VAGTVEDPHSEVEQLMKRWWNAVTIVAFLVVLAFVAQRFSGLRTSWADVRDLAPDIVGVCLFLAAQVAIFLALIWGAYRLWRKMQGKPLRETLAKQPRPHPLSWPRVAKVGVLAFAAAVAVEVLTGTKTPGTFARGALFRALRVQSPNRLNLVLYFTMPVMVDAVTCFAILCGAYLLWMDVRGTSPGRDSEVQR
jgi:hypothetical protein